MIDKNIQDVWTGKQRDARINAKYIIYIHKYDTYILWYEIDNYHWLKYKNTFKFSI